MRPLRIIMQRAPWKIFHYDGRDVIIDVDGGITIEGHTAFPFPCEITHVAICDEGLIATWVDHELRLARMALLSLSEKLEDGVSKSQLRLNRNTAMVANSTWCHIVDAEPLALSARDDKIIFALWSRGLYCIDSKDNEIWRLPLFEDKEKSPPRSNDVTAISIVDDYVIVWTRGGTYRKISLDSGEILNEESLGIECDLEEVFNEGEKFLLSSKDGWAWEFENGQITVARKLRGTIQDAVFDGEDWRIISWRDDLLLRGETVRRPDLGVQLIQKENTWMVLDNQGQFTPHMSQTE
tara:strand:+ start:118 stop:1002 length:885 start_codon:yes stop_codon:yes gene_type:complete